MKAFPWSIDNGEVIKGEKGMDLRDYFAAAALGNVKHLSHEMDIACAAYAIADAMIKARAE